MTAKMVLHVSEDPDIRRFEPRPSSLIDGLAVWAIEDARLHNYLVPRDCPRVTFYAVATSTTEDVDRFLGRSTTVVAIEEAWLERAERCQLYCYHLPADTFESLDRGAGYCISRLPVVPARRDIIDNPLDHIVRRGVELRILPSLWALHDAVAASTLQFSMIRMRNAAARPD